MDLDVGMDLNVLVHVMAFWWRRLESNSGRYYMSNVIDVPMVPLIVVVKCMVSKIDFIDSMLRCDR